MTIGLVRLGPDGAERFVRLRRRMLEAEPWAFGAGVGDDEALDTDRVAAWLAGERDAIFAVDAGGELVAAAGIRRGWPARFAHRARIWGVFVEPSHRGRGLGRALMTAAIDAARGWGGVDYLDLGVSENSPAARRLYESLGFVAWGREPEATEHEGRRYDEIFMTLRLRR